MELTNLCKNTEEFTGNVWLIENSSSENVLVDAGTGDSWNPIEKLDSVEKVIVTHSHYDHVDNLPKIVEKYSPEVYAFEPGNLPVEAEKLDEDETVELAGRSFEVIHTPGHRDDSICLYSEDENILFTGDLIFPDGGFGRTDLDDGDRDVLVESVKKVVELDIDAFYPGHGDAVTGDAEDSIRKSLEEAERHESKY